MENLALVALVENLRPAMAELIIRRVVQHQIVHFPNPIAKLPALSLLWSRRTLRSMHPGAAADGTPGMDFTMVFRKHSRRNDRLRNLSERIVEFTFKTAVPSKNWRPCRSSSASPNAPNIILLDAERRVLLRFSISRRSTESASTNLFISEAPENSAFEFLETDGHDLEEIPAQLDAPSALISRVAGIDRFRRRTHIQASKRGRRVEIRSMVERRPHRAEHGFTELPLGHPDRTICAD
jgi:predicted ribosome quality control (RQC) complex YloA/Tae2 family protein